MHEIPVVLRHHALHLEQNWHEDEKDVQKAADFLREAADEIDRLRGVLVDANNRWRHDFAKDVEEAADKLFKKLAAHRTDPIARPAIKTEYWPKPIPPRQFDWSAVTDDYEPGEPIGYGRTEQEAITDLREQLDAR